jgi:protein-disulfide isomerase
VLEREDLLRHARKLGLDLARFEGELNSHVHQARVQHDFQSGVRSGVNGTPTFFINGARHDDSWDVETLVAALSEAAEA